MLRAQSGRLKVNLFRFNVKITPVPSLLIHLAA